MPAQEYRITLTVTRLTSEPPTYSAFWTDALGPKPPFALTLPLSADDRADLRWYLESYPRYYAGAGDQARVREGSQGGVPRQALQRRDVEEPGPLRQVDDDGRPGVQPGALRRVAARGDAGGDALGELAHELHGQPCPGHGRPARRSVTDDTLPP